MDFTNKKIFVTGASRGIGAAISQAFKEKGGHVIGTATKDLAQRPDFLDDLVVADFSKIADIEMCAAEIGKYGPDIIINNAGINKIAPFVEIDPEDFLKIQQVNLYAPFRFCQAAIDNMDKKGWGRIVNISSIWGIIAKEQRASYSASKFALDGLSLSISHEYSQKNILVNCIAPGFTDTEMTRNILGQDGINELCKLVPMKKMANVDEIAKLVVWLSSEGNSYVTGQNIAIDGGFSRA